MASTHLYCTSCGAANQPQDAFCFACGRPLRTTSSMQYPTVGSASTTLTGLLTFNHLLKQRYRILEQLGTGGFGAVYKAEDTHFGNRLVAVKEMSQRELKTQQEIVEATDAFKREALMLAGLRHQHLPRIYDHFSDGGRWYLVMDYIEGETLGDHLNKAGGHLPVEEALQIGIQLCTVLDYLHTRQPPIIFRDLTPNNIMLTPDGHLYLIDFGIARLFKPGQAKDTTAFGTLGYAAPELLSRQTTPQSDIYSLGAILHQMLTGLDPAQKPFRFAPPQFSGNPALMRLSTLVMQMLDMDESRRPTSTDAIRQELRRIDGQLSGTMPIPATQSIRETFPSVLQRSQRGGKKFGSIAGIATVIVIAAFLISSLVRNPVQLSSQPVLTTSSNTPAGNTPTSAPTVATLVPTPTSVPTPTPTSSPKPGTVLYQADSTVGWSGWVGTKDWTIFQGMLIDNGTDSTTTTPTMISPYQVVSIIDYAVEVEIQIVGSNDCFDPSYIRASVTSGGWQGYKIRVCGNRLDLNAQVNPASDTVGETIGGASFTRDNTYHKYRIEARGTTIRVLLDGLPVIEANDNRFLSGGQLGLKAFQTQLNVRSFKVIAL